MECPSIPPWKVLEPLDATSSNPSMERSRTVDRRRQEGSMPVPITSDHARVRGGRMHARRCMHARACLRARMRTWRVLLTRALVLACVACVRGVRGVGCSVLTRGAGAAGAAWSGGTAVGSVDS